MEAWLFVRLSVGGSVCKSKYLIEEKIMTKESTPARYHPLHVILHWLIALLVLMMLAVGKFAMPGIPADDPQKVSMLQIHSYIGMAIGLLLVVRLIMRFTVKRPAAADAGNAFLNFLARVVHFLLYFFMIGMALSGFGLFQQANLPAVFSGTAPYPADLFQYVPRMGHGFTSWLLLAMVVLHFGAAMYHQFIRKDNLLGRMWFGKR
jgi:cytochrome b561